MLSEDNSVRYCVTTKYKSKPEYIPDKKYKPFKTEKKKKKSQSECENLFIFHIQELLLFPPIKHDKSHVKGNASGGVSESTFSWFQTNSNVFQQLALTTFACSLSFLEVKKKMIFFLGMWMWDTGYE